MLETTELTFRFTKLSDEFTFPAISCSAGESLLIHGLSGSGKTTWLSLLGGLLLPTTGVVKWNDVSISALSDSQIDQMRKKYVGMIFQNDHFIKSLSLFENLALIEELKGQGSPWREDLAALNLEGRGDSNIHVLSKGEKQRASVVRAFIGSPGIILADEPTSALDDRNCKEVCDLLLRKSKSLNAALIVVSHDQRLKNIITNQIEL